MEELLFEIPLKDNYPALHEDVTLRLDSEINEERLSVLENKLEKDHGCYAKNGIEFNPPQFDKLIASNGTGKRSIRQHRNKAMTNDQYRQQLLTGTT